MTVSSINGRTGKTHQAGDAYNVCLIISCSYVRHGFQFTGIALRLIYLPSRYRPIGLALTYRPVRSSHFNTPIALHAIA